MPRLYIGYVQHAIMMTVERQLIQFSQNSNLSFSTKKDDLEKLAAKYGKITDIVRCHCHLLVLSILFFFSRLVPFLC